jgi:hypothetical protein
MATERREIQFRGPSILDAELARPIGGAAPPAKRPSSAPLEGPLDPPGSCPECGASGGRAHASWCETARAKRDPAMVSRSEEVELAYRERAAALEPNGDDPRSKDHGSKTTKKAPADAPAPAPRGDGAVTSSPTPAPAGRTPTTSAREQFPARPGRADRSGSVGARQGADDPLTDHGAPQSAEYRQALADYTDYLIAVAELNAARVALVVAERQVAPRRADRDRALAAVEKAVDALGEDPLGMLAAVTPAPRVVHAAITPRMSEILPLLPGKPGEVARRHGGLSTDAVRQVLYDAEQRGLVRRGPVTPAAGAGGRPTYVWERVEDGDPA